MATSHAWDIYAESLTYLGYGYPLWCPDTWNQRRPWEIEIGDVGWLSDGQFCPLIRTTIADAAHQPYGKLPAGFVPFDNAGASIGGSPDRILERVLHSRKIQATAISVGISADASPAELNMGGNIAFKSTDDRGALLMLSPKGEETINRSAVLIKNYLRSNLKKWEDFANDPNGLGLGLKTEDIIFVSGVVKTVDWGVAAFLSTHHEVEGSLACKFGGIGAADISFNVTSASAANHWKRAGPSASWRLPQQLPTTPLSATSSALPPAGPSLQTQDATYSGPSSSSPSRALAPTTRPPMSVTDSLESGASSADLITPPLSPSPPKADQCIFFHYYKLKRRGIFMIPPQFELKAGAGPHDLPRDADGPSGSPGVLADHAEVADTGSPEFEEMPRNTSQHFDSVDAALDYILENSDAEVAIASDLDLYSLFEHLEEYPRDVARALVELQPLVAVDETGIGTLFGAEGPLLPVAHINAGSAQSLLLRRARWFARYGRPGNSRRGIVLQDGPTTTQTTAVTSSPLAETPPRRFRFLSTVLDALKRRFAPRPDTMRNRHRPGPETTVTSTEERELPALVCRLVPNEYSLFPITISTSGHASRRTTNTESIPSAAPRVD